MAKSDKPSPLEQGLIQAMRALDNQIARELQRTPAEQESEGVQKWEPYQERVERVCVILLDALGAQDVELDSLLVLAQAYAKCLRLFVEDLDRDGLGEVRTEYCISALDKIAQDATRGRGILTEETQIS